MLKLHMELVPLFFKFVVDPPSITATDLFDQGKPQAAARGMCRSGAESDGSRHLQIETAFR